MATYITRQGADALVAKISEASFVGLLNNGTEISGGGYSRVQYTGGFVFNAETTTYFEYRNASDIIFPIASSNWGTVNQVGLWNAQTGGALLYYSDLSVAKTVTTNDQVVIPAGNFLIRINKTVS
ncbi:MAG: hypothetical protein QW607_12145 [Desulfurococcaceae archaeon]